jgi:hypothetical protein
MGFAGTDFAEQRRFSGAVELYRRNFVRILNEDAAKNGRMYDAQQAVGGNLNLAGRDLWEQIPGFSHRPSTVGVVVRRHLASIAILLVWLITLTGCFFAALSRMRA